MKPIVILDTNALHGRRPFTRSDAILLLELSRRNEIRLVVPDVVLLELARQWSERLEDSVTDLHAALKRVNDALADIEVSEEKLLVASYDREFFYDYARKQLLARGAEVPFVPTVSVNDLLIKDLDVRKPFDRDGKGFRDALIWETIRALCEANIDPGIPVLFVTNNSKDFCSTKTSDLHPDLRQDLKNTQLFEVVSSLHSLKENAAIKPLRAKLEVMQKAFTAERIVELVDDAIVGLHGAELEQVLGEYTGDGFYALPISSALDAPSFDEVLFDTDSITSEFFRSGHNEQTIRVSVDCDVTLEGFINKSDYFASNYDGLAMLEDWNSHAFRASESHRMRFVFSAEFDETDMDNIVLTLDEAEGL